MPLLGRLTDRLRRILDGEGGIPSPMGPYAVQALVGTRLDEAANAVAAVASLTGGDPSPVASTPYTAGASDSLLVVSVPNAQIQLPAGDDHVTGSITLKDTTGNATAAPHTITPSGVETIDGEPSWTIAGDYASLVLRFYGGTWHII
jgi:hypothetical protein